jgi:hypothetical protein
MGGGAKLSWPDQARTQQERAVRHCFDGLI